MLAAFLQPWALVALFIWCFGVLSAAQLTIRLIMAYSVRQTLVAALILEVSVVAIAALFDAVYGADASPVVKLRAAPLVMIIMALVGFAEARWVLRIRRLRGQLIAALMVGLLDPHLFTLS